MSLSFLTTPSKPPTSGAATGFTSLFPSTSPGGQSPFGFGSPAGNPTGGLFGSDTSKPGGNAQGAGVGSAATGGVPPRGTSPNVGAGISGSATALPFNAPTLGSDAYVNSWLEMLALHPIFHPQRSKSVPAFPSLPRTNLIASRGEDIFVSVPGSRVVRALHLPLARDAWDTLASKSGSSKSSTSVKVSAEAVHSFATSAPFVVIAPVHPAKPHPALSPLSKKKRGANLSASPDLPTEIGFDVIQLIPNQSGRLLLVIGENRIRVIVLPRSSAISTNSTSSSTPSSGTTSNSPIIACKALDIGAFDISTDASCPIVQVAWHPMSQDAAHVCVLTLDGMLRYVI
ncbi:hypothetical protein M427DRAFT_282031 [Gonapodya prolifera JEL478]|uniref:Uncharacterized protein n=1 Tax=Gonapodya prolifera (strain JEL478) TaxID=1344416 RepID=A0A139AYX6_GONPJ|nr:hypothetical protein M427DRAFT_282031 [Gonapodya prolifera JEL478]|eukprot:KXS21917.1 hypothetical protein M427DRAFT_282031 [Gonapodya prolifera JEL478]